MVKSKMPLCSGKKARLLVLAITLFLSAVSFHNLIRIERHNQDYYVSTKEYTKVTNAPSLRTKAPMSFHKQRHYKHHPPILYGNIHMVKTGGTSLNGILANKYERVCGHKGYSYDAYADNERAKQTLLEDGQVLLGPMGSRDRVDGRIMNEIGYEDCDYTSHEVPWRFWNKTFGAAQFDGLEMELHVPCRDRIEHLMSRCNHIRSPLDCDAMRSSDASLQEYVGRCNFESNRFDKRLLDQFNVKCYDFKKQFTVYADHIARFLQPRRIESKPYVKRESNDPRNKTNECIWNDPELMAKAEKVMLKDDYYAFCNRCMGTGDEITRERTEKHDPFLREQLNVNNSTPSFDEPYQPHSKIIYGHIHIAKTGGSFLNGILANKFERVCGHKGYSYDAYADNERAKSRRFGHAKDSAQTTRSHVSNKTMAEIGYENCDYINHATYWDFWGNMFRKTKLHGLEMEIHVPCRDIIGHIMAQCSHVQRELDCDATSDEAFHKSIDLCYLDNQHITFNKQLMDQFTLKCYDFKKQLTVYTDHMSRLLQPRRIVSKPYVMRERNNLRDMENECIWSHPELMAKAEKYLLSHDYYAFCHECMGTENEITLGTV